MLWRMARLPRFDLPGIGAVGAGKTEDGGFMNIDFHYGVIYIVARWAGMGPTEAEVVAHACQYVDDSTVSGVLEFKGGQTYERFAAAHCMIDYRNLLAIQDKLVWATFHFLPAGEGEAFDEKCVCKPNSEVAKDMVRRALRRRGADNTLHRLGITLHTYVDTWAHQKFSGIISDRNIVHELKSDECPPETWIKKLAALVESDCGVIESDAVGLVSKVGHGAALHFPDLPWAKWSYRNALGEPVERDNLPVFIDAANNACRTIRSFIKRDDKFETQSGLSFDQEVSLRSFLAANDSHDPAERLDALSTALEQGSFCELKEPLPPYVGKGPGSWKALALGITAAGKEEEESQEKAERPEWSAVFEQSDYRKYHDAVQEHRLEVTREVLPKYGIRLA